MVVVLLVVVLLVTVRLSMKATVAERRLEKKLVEVALLTTKEVIVVVASVEVPRTINVPEAAILPLTSAVKLKFSVQDDPFQYKVVLVAVPSAINPSTVDQYVVEPLEVKYCPGVPVALPESSN